MSIADRVRSLWPGAGDDHNPQCHWCNAPIVDDDPVEYRGEPHHLHCRRERIGLLKTGRTLQQNKQRRGGGR